MTAKLGRTALRISGVVEVELPRCPHLQQIGFRMMQRGDPSFCGFFPVALQQHRRLAIDDVKHHGVIILGFGSNGPVVISSASTSTLCCSSPKAPQRKRPSRMTCAVRSNSCPSAKDKMLVSSGGPEPCKLDVQCSAQKKRAHNQRSGKPRPPLQEICRRCQERCCRTPPTIAPDATGMTR
jgi:hypothetical protein